MKMNPMFARTSKCFLRTLAVAGVALMPVALAAQAAPTGHGPANPSPSRFDIFAGYSYLSPHGIVDVLQPGGKVTTPYSYDAVNAGAILSGSYFFNNHVGLQVESAEHEFGGPGRTPTSAPRATMTVS